MEVAEQPGVGSSAQPYSGSGTSSGVGLGESDLEVSQSPWKRGLPEPFSCAAFSVCHSITQGTPGAWVLGSTWCPEYQRTRQGSVDASVVQRQEGCWEERQGCWRSSKLTPWV